MQNLQILVILSTNNKVESTVIFLICQNKSHLSSLQSLNRHLNLIITLFWVFNLLKNQIFFSIYQNNTFKIKWNLHLHSWVRLMHKVHNFHTFKFLFLNLSIEFSDLLFSFFFNDVKHSNLFSIFNLARNMALILLTWVWL